MKQTAQWFVTGLAQCSRRIGSWDVNLSLKVSKRFKIDFYFRSLFQMLHIWNYYKYRSVFLSMNSDEFIASKKALKLQGDKLSKTWMSSKYIKKNFPKLYFISITRLNHMATTLRKNCWRSWRLWTKNNETVVKYGTEKASVSNCPNNRTISQDICTLFACYLYSTLCSWTMTRFY